MPAHRPAPTVFNRLTRASLITAGVAVMIGATLGLVSTSQAQLLTQEQSPDQPVTEQAPLQAQPTFQDTNPSQVTSPVPASSEQIALTAIPPRLGDDGSLLALPGETIQETIRVRNTGDSTIQFSSSKLDFIIGADGQTPIAVGEDVTTRWSLADWLTLAPETDTLEPGQTAQVAVVIDVPEDALPGGHYAMITHQPSGGGRDGGTAAAVNQRVGTLLYLTVEGPINEEAFLRNVEFPGFVEYGPVPFSLQVDNQSDIHITPQISVDIHNFLGQEVETISLEQKNVFPFASREYSGQWDRVWGMGPYTAKITMSYGNQGKVTLATERFWLLPASLIAAGVVTVLSLIVILIAIRRHMDHRNDTNRQKVRQLEEQLQAIQQNSMNGGNNSGPTGTPGQTNQNQPPFDKYQ